MGPHCIETYRANALRGEFEVELIAKSFRISLQNWRSAMRAPALAWLTQAPENELAWERMAVERCISTHLLNIEINNAGEEASI